MNNDTNGKVQGIINGSVRLDNTVLMKNESDGYGFIKVLNFETVHIIYLTCKIVSIDDEKDDGYYSSLFKPIELIVHTYKVVFEVIKKGDVMFNNPYIQRTNSLMLTILETGNMNRLVKNAIRDYGRPFEPGFIFNRKTGQFAEYPAYGYAKLADWYRVTNDHYPIYDGRDFVGYCWRDEVIMNINNSIVPEDMTAYFKANRLIRHEKNYRG